MKRFLVHQVVEIGLLLVFIDCQDMRQAVHVSIFGRIEGYGDNLTFICTLDKNLQSPIDNKRWYIDGRLCSINNKTNDPEKLKAQIIPDGVQLTILNFLTQDINKTYSCIIGFYQSEKLILSESDVFRDEMINSKDDKNSDYIDTLVPVVVVALVVLGLISVIIIACRKKILCIKGNKENAFGGTIVVNDQKDEGKIEKLSPADEKRSAISSDLERTSLMNNKKNARKKQDISATDDQSSRRHQFLETENVVHRDSFHPPDKFNKNAVNYVAPIEAIWKNTAFVISGKALNVPFQSEKTAEGNEVERTDPKIPHRETINRGFQFTLPDSSSSNRTQISEPTHGENQSANSNRQPDLSSARILNSEQNSTDSQNSNLNTLHDLSSSANHKHKEYNTLNLRESSFKEPLIFNSHSIAVLPVAGSFYTEKSLPQGVKPIKGGKKGEVKQEDISPADEESDEKSLLLEMKPIKGDEKDEVKQEDISPADEESDESSLHLEGKPLMNGQKDALCQDRIPDNEERNGYGTKTRYFSCGELHEFKEEEDPFDASYHKVNCSHLKEKVLKDQ